jgi:predicted  nucleic acid-binding Zn-ribbon protein
MTSTARRQKMTGSFYQICVQERQSVYNQVMSQTLSLFRLQQIDSQLDRAHTRLQAIQIAIEDDTGLGLAKTAAQEAEARMHAAAQSLKNAEEEVKSQRIKIEQNEASLFGGTVRNPKELQDLQNDVASLKRYLTKLEDRQLEAMLIVEESEREQAVAQLALQAAQSHHLEQNQSLIQEQNNLHKEIEKLTTERAAANDPIPADVLTLYDQLRQQRRGVAVATISDSSCNACGSSLSPSQVQSARSQTQMARCPSCGRILYGS